MHREKLILQIEYKTEFCEEDPFLYSQARYTNV